MLYKPTSALYKILSLLKRLKIIQGGSSAGKTIAILLILIDRAQNEENKIFSVVSESLPHLKRGVIRDFLNIMQSHKFYRDDDWNQTDFIYSFPATGSKIEFFSAKDHDKVRGPRRSVLFINECNNVPYDVYTQLVLRTNEDIYLDYNPVSEFWVHQEVIPNMDHDFIILTYKDNEGIPQSIVDELESRRENSNFWKVYGLGILGELIGQIYTEWRVIEEIPHEARLERLGLDFGYTNDPAAIIAVYYYNGGYILDEIAYEKGLSNKVISDILDNQKDVVIGADAAEPKSIDEIKSYGHSIIPAKKGAGSVNQGIQLVQQQRISITSRSLNLLKEYRNYTWKTDNYGKPTNSPIGVFNHGMDAVRYAFQTLEPATRREAQEQERSERWLSRLKNIMPKTR